MPVEDSVCAGCISRSTDEALALATLTDSRTKSTRALFVLFAEVLRRFKSFDSSARALISARNMCTRDLSSVRDLHTLLQRFPNAHHHTLLPNNPSTSVQDTSATPTPQLQQQQQQLFNLLNEQEHQNQEEWHSSISDR